MTPRLTIIKSTHADEKDQMITIRVAGAVVWSGSRGEFSLAIAHPLFEKPPEPALTLRQAMDEWIDTA